ncbi:hypothetical protein FRX94_10055 [Corynebacterium canis]|uniref:Uncharacterized protein n=1 Tax=Corynebacterium canis TaxID=679663 RepID=A0A5C5UBX4_9CORY|nr:hypothetical protein [Corynebacterium canis]TWT23070.1 hypothetical protein FRX94_10055 [Corynebacterium canis]WJY74825.1 hypothetical protein CCANI_04890 [Corynebacterium canis]
MSAHTNNATRQIIPTVKQVTPTANRTVTHTADRKLIPILLEKRHPRAGLLGYRKHVPEIRLKTTGGL